MKKSFNILYLFLVLTTVNTIAYAQEKQPYGHWLENYEKGIDLYNNNNFIEAIPFLEKAKSYINQVDFSTNTETQYYPAYNYDHLGAAYYQTNQFEKAAESYLAALNTLRSIENVDFNYSIKMLNATVFSYEKYDPDKAVQFLTEVIDSVRSSGNEKNADYAELLFTRFQLHKGQNNTQEMIESLEEAKRIHDEIGTTDHTHYPVIVFNLAYLHYHKADYANALPYFELAQGLKDEYSKSQGIILGKIDYDYGLSLYRIGQYEKTETVFTKLLNDPWLNAPENAEFYLYSTNYIGLSAYYQNKIESAKKAYTDSFTHLSNTSGEKSEIYNLQKTNYIRLLINISDYESALPISESVYKTLKDQGLTYSLAYMNVVNNLGLIYMEQSEFDKAETFLKESLSISQMNGADPNHIASIQNNLAYVYQQISNYREAKTYHQEALDIKTQYLNPTSPDYAKAIQNFGTYLFETGEHLKAETYFKQAEDIFIKNNDTSSLLYAGLKQNLAQLYFTTSRIKESLNCFEKAINIYSEKGLENSENLANALNGKANCLIALGDINTAVSIGKQAFDLVDKNYNKESLQYGDALLTYSTILRANYNYDEADSYLSKASKIFDKYSDQSIKRKIKLAEIYIDDLVINRNYDEAFKLIEVLEEYYIKTYGFESFYYSQTLEKKAIIAADAGDLEYAIRLYASIASVFEKTITVNSDSYSNMLFNYASTLDQSNNINEAIEQYQKYNKGIQDVLKNVFTYRSEEDKKKFLQRLKSQNNYINANIFQDENLYKELISIGINNQLIQKSLLLNTSREVIANLSKSKDALVLEKVDRYGSIKFQLSDPLVLNDKERSSILRTELNALETELVKLHDQKFGNTQNQNFNRDWTTIKANLKPNEVAIEFVEFETKEDNSSNGKNTYGAYLITQNSELPKAITLFTAEDLKIILKNKKPNTLYQTRGSKAKSTTNTKGLYELIWSPLEPYLKDIETIYYSPIGLLNQIPFAALDTEEKPILAEQYKLVQLSSTYAIAENKINPKTDSTLFIGGITYDYASNENKSQNSNLIPELSMLKSASGTRSLGSKWNYLPGTLDEVNAIQNLFSENNKSFSVLSEKGATETAFKKLSGNSPSVIHIATHGFFFENPKRDNKTKLELSNQNVYTISEDPLLRSGLLFAGANYAWQNGNNPNAEDDGILTALEISNLNLSNTDLVVLSACETGLGDIEGSEGVYGLQRAFKMAGVDLIIMSLWEVPDKETSEFMTTFYTYWLGGKDIRTAFRDTQLELSATYKDNPEKWAAFVLFE